MPEYRLVVLSNPAPGREDEYNAWYDGRHLDDILRIPGFTRAQRFVNEDPLATEPPAQKYLAIYDFETDDLAGTFDIFLKTAGTDQMPISDALEASGMPVTYRVLGPAKIARADPD